MKLRTLNEWLQVLGNFAILLGLIFLIVELRQNASIARAEFVAMSSQDFNSIHQIESSGTYVEAYAKVLRNQNDLTVEELIVLDQVLTQVVSAIALEKYLQSIGVLQVDDNVITSIVPEYFGNRFAQAWWPVARSKWWPQFAERMDEEISKVPSNADGKYYEEISESLSEYN